MYEIGGYIELDKYHNELLHKEAIALNCGRNCLAYLIEARNIKTIWLPYFLCDSISNVCNKYNVKIKYYHFNYDWTIESITIDKDEYLYIVNFYGQLDIEYVSSLVKKYQRVIVDNAQAYFDNPVSGVDTIYTCRKFFGVSDGALLFTDLELDRILPVDESFDRIRYVLGRFEKTASEFYKEASDNNEFFDNEPIKLMSKLTHNLLSGVDYERVKKVRTDNFYYLNNKLAHINELAIKNVEGAYMYPLMIDNAKSIKKRLLNNQIYIPTLWPNVLNDVPRDWWEYRLANDVLPLPVDQRYGEKEMDRVIDFILRYRG
ncbi:MAG: hypothetical protein IJV92_09145 [Phascolarctobacterium sp.]|nr:hypothetical protein [Phascolarctobacterium sp.]